MTAGDVVGWLLTHGQTTVWIAFGLAAAGIAVRVGYLVVLALVDLRLRWRGGDAAGAVADWLGTRGADGRSALYHAYMASPEWQERSRRTLMLAGGTCQRCARARATQAHHLTYDRLTRERGADLLAVCKRCHDELHGR